jgi:hypothetical protein
MFMVTMISARSLVWAPRILGILVTLFIGVFALDAFGEGRSFLEALGGFAVHLTPALLPLAIVLASFRYPLAGAAGFIGLAVFYTLTMSRGRLDWIAAIAGPLLVVGVLFGWSWLAGRQTRS